MRHCEAILLLMNTSELYIMRPLGHLRQARGKRLSTLVICQLTRTPGSKNLVCLYWKYFVNLIFIISQEKRPNSRPSTITKGLLQRFQPAIPETTLINRNLMKYKFNMDVLHELGVLPNANKSKQHQEASGTNSSQGGYESVRNGYTAFSKDSHAKYRLKDYTLPFVKKTWKRQFSTR